MSDTNISKLELAEAIKKHINDLIIEENSIEKDPDQRNYIVSNEKIESCGFKTKYSLDDGIKEIIKFYPIQSKIIEIFNLYYLVFANLFNFT